VHNQIDSKLINYTDRPKQLSHYRKEVVEQAQSLLMSKAKRRVQQRKSTSGKELLP
jgi:hypothetical protein